MTMVSQEDILNAIKKSFLKELPGNVENYVYDRDGLFLSVFFKNGELVKYYSSVFEKKNVVPIKCLVYKLFKDRD